jgi:hypothetical protein
MNVEIIWKVFEAELKDEVPLQLTDSQSFHLGIEPLPGTHDQILLIIYNYS